MAKTGIRKEEKEKFVLTPEFALKEIRNLRAGKLFVCDMRYVDFLLAAHDHIAAASRVLSDMFKLANDERNKFKGDLSIANLRIAALEKELEQFLNTATQTTTF